MSIGCRPCRASSSRWPGIVAQREDPAVDGRMQRLDSPAQHLGEARELLNAADGDARFAQQALRCRPSRTARSQVLRARERSPRRPSCRRPTGSRAFDNLPRCYHACARPSIRTRSSAKARTAWRQQACSCSRMRACSEAASSSSRDLDTLLQQDRAAVQVVGDQVDRAARDLDAVLERLRHGVHGATERGQQRRMGVDHAPGVGGDDVWDQDLVEAGQDDQLDAARPASASSRIGLPLGAAGDRARDRRGRPARPRPRRGRSPARRRDCSRPGRSRAGKSGSAQASSSAWRLVPAPETSTATRSVMPRAANDDALGAERGTTRPTSQRRGTVGARVDVGVSHEDQAQAHIEDAQHLVDRRRRRAPGARRRSAARARRPSRARPRRRRAARAAGCRGCRRR